MTMQKFSIAILGFGVLVFLLGISTYWQKPITKTQSTKSSIMERDSAFLRAKQGDGSYNFSTSFIPGLGYTGSADQARQEFKDQNSGGITN